MRIGITALHIDLLGQDRQAIAINGRPVVIPKSVGSARARGIVVK
jgi:hypothetical protein